MSDEITKKLDEVSGEEIPFEEFVRRQFALLHQRVNQMETGLRTEMVERFVQVSRHVIEVKDEVGKTNLIVSETKEGVQKLDDKMFKLSRQMRDLTDKVDVFVHEHLYLKREVQDIQETIEQRH